MTKIDTSSYPYYDDYSDSKKFYKILFRPGRALQARELTQIQTIIQKQLQRFGSHLFTNRALVYPSTSMGCKYNTGTVYVKIPKSSESLTHNIASLDTYWLNKEIRTEKLVKGICVGYRITGDYVRLYIDLKSASTDGTASNFAGGNEIYVDVFGTSSTGGTQVIQTLKAIIEPTTNSVGRIASVQIPKDSIYFYNGYFVLIDDQYLFIEPKDPENDSAWNARPTGLICLEMTESVVTFEDDASVLDNATGSTNFAAPGADRLRIEGKLTIKTTDTTDQNIIKLITVRDGLLKIAHQLETDPYASPLKDQLAKRTYDESGNYTVRPFLAEALPFLADSAGINRGIFLKEDLSFAYNPADSSNQAEAFQKAADAARDIFELELNADSTPKVISHTSDGVTRYYPGTSYANIGDETSFVNLCDSRIGISVDPGIAYVRGYQREKTGITYTSVKKARTSDFISNRTIQTPLGTNIRITNVFGAPTVQNDTSNLSYGKINFHRKQKTAGAAPTEVIGTARISGIDLLSGTKGTSSAVYKLSVFDLQFQNGFDYSDVKSLSSAVNSNFGTFAANAQLKDPTTNPSLRFTGLINKREALTTDGLTHVYSPTAKTVVITWPATTAGLATIEDVKAGLTIGTAIRILTKTGGITQVCLITAVASTAAAVTITLNQQVGIATDWGTGTKLDVVYKVIGTGTLWKSNAGEKLEQGDAVTIGTGETKTSYTVFSTPANDNELNLVGMDGTTDPHVGSWSNNSVMNYLIAESVQEDSVGNAGLVYRLPHNMVRTIKGGTKGSPNTTISANYVVRRYAALNSVTSQAVFSVTDAANEKFQAGHENYSLINLSTGQWFELYSSGTTLSSSNQAKVTITNNTVSFDFFSSASKNVAVILSVEKTGTATNPAQKRLIKGTFTSGTNGTYTGGHIVINNADNRQISLKVPDVLRITRIVESANISSVPSSKKTNPENSDVTIDGDRIITGAYLLDTGQTDYYYGISKAVLRPGNNPPKGQIRIEFDYFEHVGTGDYFSVDSYPWGSLGDMTYDEIPVYASTNFGKFELRGCLDFRPVVTSETASSASTDAAGNLKFVRHRELPKGSFNCSYHVYESRKDKMYIDTEGVIKIKYGNPGVMSEPPAEPTDGLTLYDLDLMPYTADHKNCVLTIRDNRRFTMRDIAKLEKRIKKLEYYTSLSLLEKDTNDLVIKDALGNDKFKHGFMTDTFTDTSLSSSKHPDFTASIDPSTGELKPRPFENNISVLEKNSLISSPDIGRNANNYQKTDTLFTLAYTNVNFLEQPLCSRVINVNPYQSHAYVGSIKLSPWTDTWRETEIAEPLTVHDSSAYDAAASSYGPNGESIIWTGTQQVWTGQNTTSERSDLRRVVTAGHAWPSKLGEYKDKRGNLIHGTGIPKPGDKVQVPPGYTNSGDMVEYQYAGEAQAVIENTTTTSGYEYATGLRNTIEDLGWSDPVSMGDRIINIKAAEFIRTKEVSFVGKGFLPLSTLYAFFDDVDVTKFCLPEDGYGRVVQPEYRRGPFSSMYAQFTGNTIAFDEFVTVSGTQTPILSKTDSSARSLTGFGYNQITSSATDDLVDESVLSDRITIVTDGSNKWYAQSSSSTATSKFVSELVPGSVIVLPGISTEFEVERLGDATSSNTSTVALLKTPPTGAVTVSTATAAADKLEALQRLYIGKYVDISGSQQASRNITDGKIIAVSYKPATSTTSKAKLTFTLQTSAGMLPTSDPNGEGQLTIKIKDKSIAQSSAQTASATSSISLQCDPTGTVKGKFIIPDPKTSGVPKFKTGERVFRLTASLANENINTVTRSDAKYLAQGWVDVHQETFYSTRLFRESSQAITGASHDISLTSNFNTLSNVFQKDPIAQSFVVEDATGIYITAIDVFFFSKDPTLPITLQIRPLDDSGNPSTKMMYETIIDAADVVVNKVDLARQELTVIGNPSGRPGFNSGPWNVTPSSGANLHVVNSANYDAGFSAAAIQHNTPFKYTNTTQANLTGDMIPTRIVFDYPIYLTGNNTGFCFVLLTDSIQASGTGVEALEQTYQVYIAQTGPMEFHSEFATPVHRVVPLADGEPEGNNYILGTTTQLQNAATAGGVLFKSINGWTWTADQRADMKFKIHKARFNSSISAQVEFVNESLSFKPLDLDPFETVQNSSRIRVMHRNHCIPYDTSVTPNKIGKVRFTGLPSTGSLNGIPYQILMSDAGFLIESPTLDSYVIDLGSAYKATATGRIGGTGVAATENIRFEEFMAIVDPVVLPETNITWRVSGVSSRAPYDPSQHPYETISDINFTPGTAVAMPTSAQICSDLDELAQFNGRNSSFKITATLSSKDPNISPIIDQDRLSVVLKGVRLDNPAGLGTSDNNINRNVNDPDFDSYVCLPTALAPAVVAPTIGAIDSTAGVVDLRNKIYFGDTDNKLTGTSFTTSGTTITGVASVFTSELSPGSIIKHPTNNETRKVVEILSDVSLTIDEPFVSQLSQSASLLYDPPYLKFKTANVAVATHLSKLDVGKYLSLEGTNGGAAGRDFLNAKILAVKYTPNATGTDSNLGAPCLCEIVVDHHLAANVLAGLEPGQTAAAGASVTPLKLTQLDRFIDEIAPVGGSCASKYVSRVLRTTSPSNSLKVMFDGCRPEYANIDLYYKTSSELSSSSFSTKNWTKLEYSVEDNGQLRYVTPNESSSGDSFSEYEANAIQIEPFTLAQVKIVLRGGSAPLYPKVKNLRIIALEE